MKQPVVTDFFRRSTNFTAPWSAGLIVPADHDLLFTPGMIARDAEGELVAPGDVAVQAHRVVAQIRAVVEAAGGNVEDVVKLTVYLLDMADLGAIQEARDAVWPTDPPVSSTVQVARLGTEGARLEIEAVAALAPRADRR